MPHRVALWSGSLIELGVRFVGKNDKAELLNTGFFGFFFFFLILGIDDVLKVYIILRCDSLEVNMI